MQKSRNGFLTSAHVAIFFSQKHYSLLGSAPGSFKVNYIQAVSDLFTIFCATDFERSKFSTALKESFPLNWLTDFLMKRSESRTILTEPLADATIRSNHDQLACLLWSLLKRCYFNILCAFSFFFFFQLLLSVLQTWKSNFVYIYKLQLRYSVKLFLLFLSVINHFTWINKFQIFVFIAFWEISQFIWK